MPTNHDETLEQRYAREQSKHLAELTKRTPEEIAYMEQLLHNVLAERDQLLAALKAIKQITDGSQPIDAAGAAMVAEAAIAAAEAAQPVVQYASHGCTFTAHGCTFTDRAEIGVRVGCQQLAETCATCGAHEPFTGTCGASDSDTKALCKQMNHSKPASAKPVAVPDGYAQGVEAVAKMLEKKADDFASENGYDDMGSLSFGGNLKGELMRDYHSGLLELAEEVRAMKTDCQHPASAKTVAYLELALFAENQKRQDVERERDRLWGALELMLELVPEPPEANCSCHLSPPCNDCIEYGGEREAFESAKDAIAAVKSGA